MLFAVAITSTREQTQTINAGLIKIAPTFTLNITKKKSHKEYFTSSSNFLGFVFGGCFIMITVAGLFFSFFFFFFSLCFYFRLLPCRNFVKSTKSNYCLKLFLWERIPLRSRIGYMYFFLFSLTTVIQCFCAVFFILFPTSTLIFSPSLFSNILDENDVVSERWPFRIVENGCCVHLPNEDD